jgi:hypothetical protein
MLLVFARPAWAEDFLFTNAEADCAAEMIFMNECSGKSKNLLFWSPDEAFPSLGIGHFIWYPEKKAGPYQESFPAFLSFADEIGLPLPDWINELPGRHSPWRTREEFMRDLDSDRSRQLRAFLSATKSKQAQFIIRRFIRVFPTILDDLDETDRQSVRAKYDLLMRRREGTFAMVDYVNFKGEGFLTDARYEGGGWGLAQVLMEMNVPDDPDEALDQFIAAAERVLERRVARSPRRSVEAKWLPGWKNRLRNYSEVNC